LLLVFEGAVVLKVKADKSEVVVEVEGAEQLEAAEAIFLFCICS
jgi:hypothetical protein